MALLKALPELISAALLLAIWAEPLRFGLEWFKFGVLALLLEFFVVHASGFMGVLMYDAPSSRALSWRSGRARLFRAPSSRPGAHAGA